MPGVKAQLVAAIATALVPVGLAALVLWLVPQGCDIRGDATLYEWTCLLPGLMISVPVVVAVVLPLAMALNARFGRRIPDGWLPTVILTGAATHLVIVLGYFFLLNPAYRGLFLWEALWIPQPFLAGAIAAAVHCVALGWWAGRSRGALQSPPQK